MITTIGQEQGRAVPLKHSQRFWRVFSLFVLLVAAQLLLAACSSTSSAEMQSSKVDTLVSGNSYEVASEFRELYQALGGEDILGEAISPLEKQNGYFCQYTVNVQMCLDPAKNGVDRFLFSPLGKRQYEEGYPAGSPIEPVGQQVINGFVIFQPFESIFNALYGERFIGLPLGEAVLSRDGAEVIQFFQNAAIAQKLDENFLYAGEPYLLPLGKHICGDYCLPGNFSDRTSSAIPALSHSQADFAAAMNRLGGAELLGEPLTTPFLSPEGYLMQVFENAVVRSMPDEPGNAVLHQITRSLNMKTWEPRAPLPENPNRFVFYNLNGTDGKGYYVPDVFHQYIEMHMGRAVSGDPLAEPEEVETGIFWQCFEHYCLEYNENAAPGFQVRIAPLGKLYLKQLLESGFILPDVLEERRPEAEDIILSVSEGHPEISPDESQTIFVQAVERSTGIALEGLNLHLYLTLPNQEPYEFQMSSTGPDGVSGIVIPPIPLEHASLVKYKVCAYSESPEESVCVAGAYLVWLQP